MHPHFSLNEPDRGAQAPAFAGLPTGGEFETSGGYPARNLVVKQEGILNGESENSKGICLGCTRNRGGCTWTPRVRARTGEWAAMSATA